MLIDFSSEVSYPSGWIFGAPADTSLVVKRLLLYAVFVKKSDIMPESTWIDFVR